ncbi:MAG TPA: S41 family peptidase [Aliidongia sp.]|uniref:S41 family peptidase n=1 Tax=Aliidongia sp. TaxID=1914230 RepID=UPI002DDD3A54|nr:S41 family peptidase [Aliidongia sp.]HEV2676816.1 S41 family peptidase [Aliidongia sp.]
MASEWSGCIRVGRRSLGGAVLLLSLMSACASTLDTRGAHVDRFGHDPAATLFADAFRDIREFYLVPISSETLALAGLAKLDQADQSFAVAEIGHTVVFFDKDNAVERLPAPDADDADGWAAIVSSALADVRQHSPDLSGASNEALYQKVFDGIVPKLDRFTRYAGADAARDQRASRDGFGGIGITLDYSDGQPRVSTVATDTPAAKEIRVDDRLVAINDVQADTLSERQVVDRLRGEPDSTVTVTLRRPGRGALVTATMRRALIVVPTVTTDWEDGIAVFHVSSFNIGTAQALADGIAAARKDFGRQMKGIVLDLRGNPGGLLEQATDVASLFIDRGEIVSTRGRDPTATQEFKARTGDKTRGLPMVVLVNGGSASSAEIVAAALQDHDRAVLVGTSSYGKGTVQRVLTLPNQGELTLTWARLYTPSHYVLHEHGVVPVFCTSRLGASETAEEPAARLAAIIERGLHPRGLEAQSRANLSDPAWIKLRKSCPAETEDNPLDLKLARRLLRDPSLYAAALATPAIALAQQSSGHSDAAPLQ